MPISTPVQIKVPFATSGLKNPIPAASDPVNGKAGYDAGFPAINMTPKTAGGIAPFGEDFNGIFFDVTTAIQFLESGGSFPFSASFASAVGGYPIGALVSRTDSSGLWRNFSANNTTDPEAGGAGWQPEDAGSTTVTMTNANVTLTPLQAARSIITLSGSITTNLNLIMPLYIKRWLIVNNCTGNFTVTVKTASGSGVDVATGASRAVFGDGANILSQGTSGALIRTSVYVNNGGVLQVSIDGGSFVNAPSSVFTKHPLSVFAEIEGCGGGGGGGTAQSTNATQVSAGSGGGGGGYVYKRILSSSINGLAISVGAGGASNLAGGTSSFGGLLSATGGAAGQLGLSGNASGFPFGGSPGGQGSGGDINGSGEQGGYAFYVPTPQQGYGGASQFGFGALALGVAAGSLNGSAAFSFGSGGSGGANNIGAATNASGGLGKSGCWKIKEYM